MTKFLTAATLGLVLAGTIATAAAPQADARTRGRYVSVQGSGGHGYRHARSISRQPGAVSAHRNTQFNNGRGMVSDRNSSWGNGSYQGGATHTTNNGTTFGRSTSVVNNGDGSYTGSVTRTRPDGSTGTRTVTRSPN